MSEDPYVRSAEGFYDDRDVMPPRDGLEEHQVWVWLAGARPPHWEIRGTGVVFP